MHAPPFARALALAASIAGASGPASPAAAQAPPAGSFGESVAVDLMTVEVLAVDGRGQVVHDLTREDFRVFEDGRAMPLTHFEAPTAAVAQPGGQTPATLADPAAAAPPAHVVIVVDNLNMGIVNRPRLFEALDAALDASLRPGDRTMVIDYDGSLRVALPFTDSRSDLAAALATQHDGEGRYVAAALDRGRALEDLERVAQVERDGGTGCMSIGPMAWESANERHSEVLQTIRALRSLVATLSGVPGRKNLIYVSDGVPMNPGAAEVQYAIDMCDGTAMAAGIANARDVTSSPSTLQTAYWDPTKARIDIQSLDASNEWYLLAAQASAQRVVFFPLQASGLLGFAKPLGGQVRTTAHVETLLRRDPQDTLTLLAGETGGSAILHTNDFASALSEALEGANQSYVLGFTPPTGGEDRRHALRVEVNRPGIELRYPQSYYRKTPHGQMADAVASSLLHGVEANPLGLEVALGADRANDGQPRLRVSVPLDRATLLPTGDGSQGLITVFLAMRHEEDAPSQVRQKTIQMRVAAGETTRVFVHEIGLALEPGRNQVAVGVYDEIGGTLSYMRREVTISGDAARPETDR